MRLDSTDHHGHARKIRKETKSCNTLSLNFAHGETIDMLRDAVRDFARTKSPPRRRGRPRQRVPRRSVEEIRRHGAARHDRAEEYGGTNMGYLAHIVAMEEISRASASVGLSTAPFQPPRQPDQAQRHRGPENRSTCPS